MTAKCTPAANLFDALKEGYYGKVLIWRTSRSKRRSLNFGVLKPEPKDGARRRPRRKPFEGAGQTSFWMHEKVERPRSADRLDVQDQDAGVGSCDVRHDQRHRPSTKGTPHEQRRPFEVFINSKNLDHFQWIVALTRVISAVFRKGGDNHIPGRGTQSRVRSPRAAIGNRAGKFHALDHRRAGIRD